MNLHINNHKYQEVKFERPFSFSRWATNEKTAVGLCGDLHINAEPTCMRHIKRWQRSFPATTKPARSARTNGGRWIQTDNKTRMSSVGWRLCSGFKTIRDRLAEGLSGRNEDSQTHYSDVRQSRGQPTKSRSLNSRHRSAKLSADDGQAFILISWSAIFSPAVSSFRKCLTIPSTSYSD